MFKQNLGALIVLIATVFFSTPPFTHAQTENNAAIAEAVNGLQLRSIGPVVMGGRIADIAVNPTDPSTWYVATGSGNLRKPINRGITCKLFLTINPPNSIGTVAIYPSNPEIV